MFLFSRNVRSRLADTRLASPCSRRIFNVTLLTLPFIFLVSLPSSAFAGNRATEAMQGTATLIKPNPDLMLIDVYKSLSGNDIQKAQIKIDELVSAYPNFQLGHLVRGDLIAMRTRPVAQFGAATNAPTEKLKDLHEEALARIRAITERPMAELIPSNLLQMNEDQRYALVMDAKRARIFLYENIAGTPKLVVDYYVSQGKLGIDKFKEGDQRTPLGVYYITNRLPGAKLPDFYGPGALPLSYPNEWDKMQGRGGKGIWLHGVPSGNYSRPPLASDGCVVLSNPDFIALSNLVDIAKTPVIISEQLNFISRDAWIKDKQAARKLLEDWRLDFNTGNTGNLTRHYSKKFKLSSDEAPAAWITRQLQIFNTDAASKSTIREVSQFRYPGRAEMIVSNFTQDVNSSRGLSSIKRRQYWLKEAGQWHIILEEQNTSSGIKIDGELAKFAPATVDKNEKKTDAKLATTIVKSADNKSTSSGKQINASQNEVSKTVEHWVSVWSNKNTKAYLAHYAKDFQTPSGESRKSWMEERTARIEGKSKISVKIEKPTISIEGNSATVKFRQNYQSGALVASSRKTLAMVKHDGKWLIKQEKTGS